MNSKQTEEQQSLDEKIKGIVVEIFYAPATNDKSLESISNGIRKVKELLAEHAALPSKPVGDVEEMAKESFEKISKTNLFENNLIYNIGNKRDSYFIAKRIFSEGFKSGYAAAPSKPVGEDATVTEQEMSSLRWLLNVSSEKPKTQLFTALDNCCDKEGISNRTHLENLWNKIKSGYAAAPQKGMKDELTLTIQQALELWEDARDYCDGWLYDKRTYFLNKFGFDIDKTVKWYSV